MIFLKYAKGTRHSLGLKIISQCGLTIAEGDLFLSDILDDIQGNNNINYDFEAIEYVRKELPNFRKKWWGSNETSI